MMAVWRRKPDSEVIVHSDQGSQYGSDDWQRFCRANNLAPSMSRRGNCWDNAVAESFFSSLKKEGSENASIKHGIWPGPISSITLKCSTIGPGATVTSEASVQRPSNRHHREGRICLLLWGQSIQVILLCSLLRVLHRFTIRLSNIRNVSPMAVMLHHSSGSSFFSHARNPSSQFRTA